MQRVYLPPRQQCSTPYQKTVITLPCIKLGFKQWELVIFTDYTTVQYRKSSVAMKTCSVHHPDYNWTSTWHNPGHNCSLDKRSTWMVLTFIVLLRKRCDMVSQFLGVPHKSACACLHCYIISYFIRYQVCPLLPFFLPLTYSSFVLSFGFLRPGDHPYASGIRRWIEWAGFPTKSDVRKIVHYVATCLRMPISPYMHTQGVDDHQVCLDPLWLDMCHRTEKRTSVAHW